MFCHGAILYIYTWFCTLISNTVLRCKALLNACMICKECYINIVLLLYCMKIYSYVFFLEVGWWMGIHTYKKAVGQMYLLCYYIKERTQHKRTERQNV